ncbi:MAG: hypothetical protein ACLQOO_35265 [Terriglobia bacterium]
MKRTITVSMCLFAVCLMLLACVAFSGENDIAQAGVITKSQHHQAIKFDVSPPLRDLLARQQFVPSFPYREADNGPLKPKLQKQLRFAALRGQAPVKENEKVEPLAPVAATVGVNVLAVGVGFHGYTVPDAPTDSNMASGDWPGNQANAQVVGWSNVSYAVFNKATGAFIAGPILGKTLWAGFGGSCQNENSGDIIAQFDKMAHRWVLFQPAFTAPFASCFAISTTPDATGTYYRYAFPQNAGFPDYPKLGIMPDAYYQSQNMFNSALTAFIGVQPCAYNRVKMLVGDATAEQICTLEAANNFFDDSMVPADLDSPELPPPVGTPGVFLGAIDNFASETHLYEYTYSVNFTTLSATLTGAGGTQPILVTTPTVGAALPAFVGLCNFGSSACVAQKGTTSKLDSLGDRLMYRLALRRTVNAANVPVNHWLISHAIVNGATGAERWYELRSPNNNFTALSLYQGGTFAPDANYRFMGSLAMDKAGNIALGYSRSSSTLYPDIWFTGRVPADAAGTLDGEAAIVDQTVATGSQRSTSNRWGDYSSMSIDLDGCTFWYTNQYYTTPNATFAWSTRVASLAFANCTPNVLQ